MTSNVGPAPALPARLAAITFYFVAPPFYSRIVTVLSTPHLFETPQTIHQLNPRVVFEMPTEGIMHDSNSDV